MVNLYVITNKVNKKEYIGITTRTLEIRFKRHKCDANRQYKRTLSGLQHKTQILYNAFIKHGVENFHISLIKECGSWEEACVEERREIAYRNTFIPQGYNMTLGGEGAWGCRPSAETREKLRIINTGRYFSPEWRARIGAAQKGRPKKKHTFEARKKISEALAGKARRVRKRRPQTLETREKIRNNHWSRDPVARALVVAKLHKKTMSEAGKAKLRADRTGKPLSVEHREKLAALRRHRRPNGTFDGTFEDNFP